MLALGQTTRTTMFNIQLLQTEVTTLYQRLRGSPPDEASRLARALVFKLTPSQELFRFLTKREPEESQKESMLRDLQSARDFLDGLSPLSDESFKAQEVGLELLDKLLAEPENVPWSVAEEVVW